MIDCDREHPDPLANYRVGNGEGDPIGIWTCQTCGGSLACSKDHNGTHQCPPKGQA